MPSTSLTLLAVPRLLQSRRMPPGYRTWSVFNDAILPVTATRTTS